LDKEKLLPGADWELEIRRAVREADVVVVCLSKQFNQAGFRQKEVRIALDTAMEKPEGDIFIIPARLEECETLESLSKWQWVDLFEADGLQRLIRALRARADRIGATLRIRKGGQSTIYRPKNKEPEKITESSTSDTNIDSAIVIGAQETQSFEKAEAEATEKASREREEYEKAEKARREKLKREAAEKAARERAEREIAENLAQEKLERETAEKARREEAKHEAAKKAKREREEWWTARKAVLEHTISNFSSALQLFVNRLKPKNAEFCESFVLLLLLA
jgi:hypothetical protein